MRMLCWIKKCLGHSINRIKSKNHTWEFTPDSQLIPGKWSSRVMFSHFTLEKDTLIYKSPTSLWVILGWFNASAGITIKDWVSNILWLLVSVRKGTQMLKFCRYYCFYYGLDKTWGRYTPKYLASNISACQW